MFVRIDHENLDNPSPTASLSFRSPPCVFCLLPFCPNRLHNNHLLSLVFAVTVIEFVVDIAVVVAVAEVIVVVVVVAVNVDWPCLIHLTTSNLKVSCHCLGILQLEIDF